LTIHAPDTSRAVAVLLLITRRRLCVRQLSNDSTATIGRRFIRQASRRTIRARSTIPSFSKFVCSKSRREFTTRQENFLLDDPLDPIAKNATSHNRFGILTSNLMALPCHFANFASLSLFSAIGFEN
jgi:hypothetical protein